MQHRPLHPSEQWQEAPDSSASLFPSSCTELNLPSPVCAPRAAALPSLPFPGSHRAHTAQTGSCSGNSPQTPCQPPYHALLKSPAHPRGETEPDLSGSVRSL